jgi:hypothetical protein
MEPVRRPAVADSVLAALLALAALSELVLVDDPVTAFRVAVALGGTLPLVVRRRFPLAVLVAVMVVLPSTPSPRTRRCRGRSLGLSLLSPPVWRTA